jgi:hypothetical protein
MDPRTKLYDVTGNVKPYVDRAMTDEKLREDILKAFATARGLYYELMKDRDQAAPVRIATRVATDDDVRDRLREAVEDLRRASERLQGKRDRSGRNAAILIAGIALGLLFNPITGPETRRFIKDLVGGGSSGGDLGDESSGDVSSNGRT